MPLMLNAWTQKRTGRLEYWLFVVALAASLLGVFMGASRSWAGLLILAIGSTFLMGQMTLRVLLGSIALAVCVGLIVASNPRLQRFTSLQDTDMVESRFATSVNESFVNALHDYPMGNGLGGGGTSIPYFLQDRVKDYGRDGKRVRENLARNRHSGLVDLAHLYFAGQSPIVSPTANGHSHSG